MLLSEWLRYSFACKVVCVISQPVVYLDDSGTHRDSPVVCLGGWIGYAHRWKKFAYAWRGALGDFGVDYYDSNRLAHHCGQFEGWDESKRKRFMVALQRITAEHLTAPIMSCVEVKPYKKLVRSTSDKRRAGSPTTLAMKGILINAAGWAKDFSFTGRIGFVIDRGMRSRGEISSVMARLGTQEHLRKEFHIGSLADGVVSESPELQAADMHAYEAFRFVKTQLTGEGKFRMSLGGLLYPFRKDLSDEQQNYSKGFNEKAIKSYLDKARKYGRDAL